MTGSCSPGTWGSGRVYCVVTVRGVQATLVTDEAAGASFFAWQENGVNFAIAGRIGKDEAIKMAESLK